MELFRIVEFSFSFNDVSSGIRKLFKYQQPHIDININFKEFHNLTLKFILYGCNND
jgi:hypothetical protein